MAEGNLPAVARPSAGAIVSFDEMERMADAFAKSNLFGAKTKEQALSLLMIAQAEGIHPALAVMEYDIIEGKPARKAERLLARFQMSGGKVAWTKFTNAEVWAKFSHPQGSDVEVKWAIDSNEPDVTSAKKITFYKKGFNGESGKWVPLTDKYNWKSWPRAMLRSRVISEGVRTCFPGAALVTLTSEEAQDVQVLSVEHIDDVDQRTEEERAGEERTSHAAKKDGDGAWADAALNACRAEAELDELLASSRWKKLPKGWKKTYGDKIETLRERLKGAEPVASTFEALKEAGLACAQMETPEAAQEAFEVWSGSLTPEKLAACTEDQRDELRTLYRNIKAEIDQ